MNIAFIGGGNMASAIIGGLLGKATDTPSVHVVEPFEATRTALASKFSISIAAEPTAALQTADLCVLAVKPQQMRAAVQAAAPFLRNPLIVSIAAGTRIADIRRWLKRMPNPDGMPSGNSSSGTTQARIVRTMPNTPALVGAGITGLYAGADVDAAARAQAESVLAACGKTIWVAREELLDPVTAVSGSGPAYAFYFLEAMIAAGTKLGLDEADARTLAVETFAGAAKLAAASDEPLSLLRERVTSKGGTTYAALETMRARDVGAAIEAAVVAASQRATELADEFGKAG
jgi:pyrroline-5-carboxylate reductase